MFYIHVHRRQLSWRAVRQFFLSFLVRGGYRQCEGDAVYLEPWRGTVIDRSSNNDCAMTWRDHYLECAGFDMVAYQPCD